MQMNLGVLKVFFRFYIEWTFASLIFVVFHLLSSQQISLLPMMGIAAAASLVFAILLEKKPNLGKPLYFLAILPLIFFSGSLSGLEVFYTAIIAILTFWRVLKFHQDSTSHAESLWLVLTFLIGVFVSPLAYYYGGEYLMQIAFLLIFQVLFILSGQFLLRWMEVETASKKRFMVTYSKLLGGILLLVTALTFGRDLLKDVFFFVMQVIGWTLSYLLYPFFAWIASPGIQERANKAFSNQKPLLENEAPIEPARQVFDPNFWGPIVFTVLIGIAFYYMYRNTSIFRKEKGTGIGPAGTITAAPFSGPAITAKLSKGRATVPVNQIRMEIFQLEKLARKKKLERLNHEGIDEWFKRLGIQYDQRTVDAYERVRYGEHFDEQVTAWFKEDIRKIRKQFNSLERLRKDMKKTALQDTLKNVFKRD